MRTWNRVIGVVLSCVTATAVSVGTGGTAHAQIVNPSGYTHLKVGDSGQCLMANADTGAVQQWRCLNAASEEWRTIPVSPTGGSPTHFLLANHWTTMCMAVPNWPVNGTLVVQAPCDAGDVRQHWRAHYLAGDGFSTSYHIQSLQGALCLDKPDGDNSEGLQMQMWACASMEPNWNPFFDFHYEQWWRFV
jgi:hypothetical protein